MGCSSSKKEDPVLVAEDDPPPTSPEHVNLEPGNDSEAPAPAEPPPPVAAPPSRDMLLTASEKIADDAEPVGDLMRSSPIKPPRKSLSAAGSVSLDDFEIGRLLGRGAFGKVWLATYKESGTAYAMKSLNKNMLVAVKQVQGALSEREVLKQRGHTCVVRMHWAFQDSESLHMVLDYMPGGDLYERIVQEGTVSLERAKLYCAQIALGLGHLHDTIKVIYCDLKPENVLLDAEGHARLTDFGLSTHKERGVAQCGSTEYMAPEVVTLTEQRKSGDGDGPRDYDKSIDWRAA
jgi:serine/threonine protein kinase